MAKYCNVEKFKDAYLHMVGTQFDNAIYEMRKDRFCDDVFSKSVLDNIKAKINSERSFDDPNFNTENLPGLLRALQIIDECMSEDKKE